MLITVSHAPGSGPLFGLQWNLAHPTEQIAVIFPRLPILRITLGEAVGRKHVPLGDPLRPFCQCV